MSVTEFSGSWPAQQLADFLGALSTRRDPADAGLRGIERVAEAFEAEVVAIVRSGCEPLSIGFSGGRAPEGLLEALADRRSGSAELPRLGECALVREPLDPERMEWLLVARASGPLDAEERDLLRGMARVLGLTREMLMRRRLLECVSDVQRQIVRRTPSDEVLAATARGAAELTGSGIAVIRQIDPDRPGHAIIGASVGFDRATLDAMRADDLADGIGQIARRENRLVVSESYQTSPHSNPVVRATDVQAAMAAPVHEGESVVGSLVVASRGHGRRYRSAEREALETFAQYASMALTDARLVAEAVHRSMHDALTELPNRVLFADRLEQALSRAERSSGSIAVLFLDVDRFKTVNDSLGHTAGDELLVAAARRLQACIRPGDTAARFGGDEFAVLVEDADEAFGRLVGERILRAFAEPFKVGRREVHLGASVGIAIARHPGDDPLRDGDLAMYRAKAEGRGRCAVFRPVMRAEARARLELGSELRGAAERGELLLEYQPIVELVHEGLAKVEALVRWDHPRRGRLAPDAFLPLAEETREIVPLGRWVLGEACAQAQAWQPLARGGRLAVTVNLSPTQLHATDVVRDVEEALARTGLDPGALVLELTETVITEDVDSAAERLRALKELGVAIAIDDFGTGYCSLQYLQRFPIDYLKIARPFIADVDRPDGDLSLIRAIVDLGTGCGLTVVAEGVERPGQRARLLEIGCELGQGYLFGAPVASGAFEARLLRRAAWGPDRGEADISNRP